MVGNRGLSFWNYIHTLPYFEKLNQLLGLEIKILSTTSLLIPLCSIFGTMFFRIWQKPCPPYASCGKMQYFVSFGTGWSDGFIPVLFSWLWYLLPIKFLYFCLMELSYFPIFAPVETFYGNLFLLVSLYLPALINPSVSLWLLLYSSYFLWHLYQASPWHLINFLYPSLLNQRFLPTFFITTATV